MKTSIAAVALGIIFAMAMAAAAAHGSARSPIPFHVSLIGGGQFPPVW